MVYVTRLYATQSSAKALQSPSKSAWWCPFSAWVDWFFSFKDCRGKVCWDDVPRVVMDASLWNLPMCLSVVSLTTLQCRVHCTRHGPLNGRAAVIHEIQTWCRPRSGNPDSMGQRSCVQGLCVVSVRQQYMICDIDSVVCNGLATQAAWVRGLVCGFQHGQPV